LPTRNELQELTQLRLQEAEALFEKELLDGAAYLCGYAVELALKARICRLLDTRDYPDQGKLKAAYATHDLDQLLFLAGLTATLKAAEGVFGNWSTASSWRPERRYQPPGTAGEAEVLIMLNAIRDRENGVLQWIEQYW
jgi:hypothetical protein